MFVPSAVSAQNSMSYSLWSHRSSLWSQQGTGSSDLVVFSDRCTTKGCGTQDGTRSCVARSTLYSPGSTLGWSKIGGRNPPPLARVIRLTNIWIRQHLGILGRCGCSTMYTQSILTIHRTTDVDWFCFDEFSLQVSNLQLAQYMKLSNWETSAEYYAEAFLYCAFSIAEGAWIGARSATNQLNSYFVFPYFSF